MVKRNDGTSKEDICQNQFTAYVVLAVKRKRQAYIKKKMRDKEKQTKTEEKLSKFKIEGDDVQSTFRFVNHLMPSMTACDCAKILWDEIHLSANQ